MSHVPEWADNLTVAGAAIIVALIASVVVGRAFSRMERYLVGQTPSEPNQKRAKTISGLLRVIAIVAIWIIALLTVLAEIGVQIGPLLAAAGVGGIVIGLGAQTFVKDLIGGFFVLAERQYDIGDVVEVGGVEGTVESIGIRTTILRGLDASRYVVPNGEVRVSTNKTRDFSRYLFDLPVPYDIDPQRAIQVVEATDVEMRSDPRWHGDITGPVEVLGLDDYGESAILVRLFVPCRAGRQWAAGREFRSRLKANLDAAGISMPFPHRELIVRQGQAVGASSEGSGGAEPDSS